MDNFIRDIINSYLTVFDSYTITSDALQKQVDEFKKKMTDFADSQSSIASGGDIVIFNKKLAESGLMEEYSALLTKIAMAGAGTADADGNAKSDYSDAPAAPVISVRNFLEQYRASYDEIKKAGYRKQGEAAYKNLFAVAERTEDMLDAQIIMEEERLLWKISPADSIDHLGTCLEAMDPIRLIITRVIEQHLEEGWKKANSEEELRYLLDRMEVDNFIFHSHEYCMMNLAIWLLSHLTAGRPPGNRVSPEGYCVNKFDLWICGGEDDEIFKDMGESSLLRWLAADEALRRTLQFMEEQFDMSFDDLLAKERLKIWLLSPQNTGDYPRIQLTQYNPQNYEVYRRVVYEEVLAQMPYLDRLKREHEKVFWFHILDSDKSDAYAERASGRAKELNAHLTYFQYIEKLRSIADEHIPKDMDMEKKYNLDKLM